MPPTEENRTTDRLARRMALLAEAGALLSASLEYEVTVASVARLAVPDLADWCSVDMVGADGQIERLAVAHVDAAKVEWAREVQRRFPPDPESPSGVPNVLRTGRAEIHPIVTDEMLAAGIPDPEQLALIRQLGLSSVMVVPLTARGRTLGAMTFVGTAESGRHFDDWDLALAQELAQRSALAVDNARLYREAQSSGEALRRYEEIFRLTEQGLAVNAADSQVIELINPAFARLYGCEHLDEMVGKPIIEVYAPERRAEARENIRRAHAQGHYVFESEHLRRDGSKFPVSVDITAVKDAAGQALYRVVNVTDISERKAAEAVTAGQNRLLERIAVGAPLAEVLSALCVLIEGQAPSTTASVLLLDGSLLRLGAAPSLPPEYADILQEGFLIGPQVGSCGTAASLKQPVLVTDIEFDPKWASACALPLAHGLRACWSTPILGEADQVLGTFGVFFRERRGPTLREKELVQVATHLARIAIERDRVEKDRRSLVREMLGSLTNGRLRLCLGPEDLPEPLPPLGECVTLARGTLTDLRRQVRATAEDAGFPAERIGDLTTGVDEAASNAVKHAPGGTARLRGDMEHGILQVWIEDHGGGIAEAALHRAVLERGYSTTQTLGHGFWLMLRTCDRISLCTGPAGTTVVLEQNRSTPPPPWMASP